MVRAGRLVARAYGGPLEGLRRARQRAFFVRVRNHGRKTPFGDRRAEGKPVEAMTGARFGAISGVEKRKKVPCTMCLALQLPLRVLGSASARPNRGGRGPFAGMGFPQTAILRQILENERPRT